METQNGEAVVAEAARILVSLRSRLLPLRRQPEWALLPTDVLLLADSWLGKGQRLQRRPRVALPRERLAVVALEAPNLGERLGSCGGAGSRGEEVSRSTRRREVDPKVKDELTAPPAPMPGVPLCCGAVAGSGPTTSGVDGAKMAAQDKAMSAAEMEVLKVDMEVSSPDTPLRFSAAAARSGASSSGDHGARSPAKRKAARVGGSGAASSGEEGCSPPSKRARPASPAGGGAAQSAVVAVNLEEPEIHRHHERSRNRDKNGILMFDLNKPLTEEEELKLC